LFWVRRVRVIDRTLSGVNNGKRQPYLFNGLRRKCHVIKTAEDKQHVGEWPSELEKQDAQPRSDGLSEAKAMRMVVIGGGPKMLNAKPWPSPQFGFCTPTKIDLSLRIALDLILTWR